MVSHDSEKSPAPHAESWATDMEVSFTHLGDRKASAEHDKNASAKNADALAKKYMEEAVTTAYPGQVIWKPEPAGFDSTMTGVWKV